VISSCRLVIQYDTCFPALRCRFRSRFRNRFRKNRVRTCRSVCRCWGVCSALARQAQEAGGRVSCAKEWAELQASWLRTERQVRKIELDPIWTDQRQRRTYGNRERYFLRELRSSYGILTYERNCYVLLQRTTAIRLRRNGSGMLETMHDVENSQTGHALSVRPRWHADVQSHCGTCPLRTPGTTK